MRSVVASFHGDLGCVVVFSGWARLVQGVLEPSRPPTSRCLASYARDFLWHGAERVRLLCVTACVLVCACFAFFTSDHSMTRLRDTLRNMRLLLRSNVY